MCLHVPLIFTEHSGPVHPKVKRLKFSAACSLSSGKCGSSCLTSQGGISCDYCQLNPPRRHAVSLSFLWCQYPCEAASLTFRSFFQSVCVLGYCILPLVLACLFLTMISFMSTSLWLRVVIVGLGLAWSVKGMRDTPCSWL